MIPYARQAVTQADIDAVVEVLRSEFLTQGPVVPRFEQAVASRTGSRHAVAVNSATSALHIACMAMGLKAGDVLWTVPNTFVASANCGRYCGAEVDFVDIDPVTWNLSVPALEEKLTLAERSGRLPKILVPVHFGGQPTEQQAIWELAKRYGFRVLEDASHSIGATRGGEPVGSCRWSDITVFSFHPVKIITTGEGGMALTNDDRLADAMQMLRTHGITRDPSRFTAVTRDSMPLPGGWYYEQQLLGFNYRLTEIHAALGISQLERLDANVGRRNELAERYHRAFAGMPLQLPAVQSMNRSAYHLYVVRLPEGTGQGRHRAIFDDLRKRDIHVNLHYQPVHLQPYYRLLGFGPGQFPQAETHGMTAITLPLFVGLSDAEQDRVVDAVTKTLGT